ncbi:MAG: PHP domain-containing protein [Syntrophomonadaceae bacterium]|jgi:putative hydrolase|nr:PHP domain-containing protein [Syntrophomonadaceae bacterium]
MNFFGDYHTHSRYSDGRQGIENIVHAAFSKGLLEVAITDHGPLAAVIGVKKQESYLDIKEEIYQVQRKYPNIHILLGAEANIRDLDGTLDLDEEIMEELDILIAGLHPYTWPTSIKDGWSIMAGNSLRRLGPRFQKEAVKANTRAIVAALNRYPQIDILSHPGLFFKVHIEEVAWACKIRQVLFEINCAHKYPPISDIIEANRVGVKFIINSDAHFQESVGNLDYGSWIADKLGINRNTIANRRSGGGYKKWSKKAKDCAYS